MRIRAYRFHLLGAVSEEASFPTRIYSTPIDRCAISKFCRKPRERAFINLSHRPAIKFFGVRKNFPGHSSDFVGQCDDNLVAMHTLFELGNPAS